MNKKIPAKKTDIHKAINSIDRGESIGLMEPLNIPEGAQNRPLINDLAVELAAKSAGFRQSLPKEICHSLSKLVRSMNCYYSNLIEGHDTHPIDIERALKKDFNNDPQKRNLQKEARAHIEVQSWIDESGLKNNFLSTNGIKEIHRRFCQLLPKDLLWLKDTQEKQKVKVLPGELRKHDVQVGGHIAISPGAVPRFLKRFEEAYKNLGITNRIITSAVAHHRLLWIHPFTDGNGRVARLMSYAILNQSMDTKGIWSIARGLARNEAQYKQHLYRCDQPRQSDLDGRGNLSQKALVEFVKFFLKTCIDQVNFMQSLVEPNQLKNRIMTWCRQEINLNQLPKNSDKVLEALLYQGEIPRQDISEILNMSERNARRITSALLQKGVISSTGTRDPLNLAFPASLASYWMPGLFPDKL